MGKISVGYLPIFEEIHLKKFKPKFLRMCFLGWCFSGKICYLFIKKTVFYIFLHMSLAKTENFSLFFCWKSILHSCG